MNRRNTRRVARCSYVNGEGLQCTLPEPKRLTARPVGGGFYELPPRHRHTFDPDDAGHPGWRRLFLKVRVPR